MTKTALIAVSFLTLAACGGGDNGETEAMETGDNREPATAETSDRDGNRTPTVTNRMFNGFSFSSSGDAEILSEYALASLSLTGGCRPGEGLGLGFMDNSGTGKPTWFYIQLEGDEAPAPGQTGTYEVDAVKWFNGQRLDPDIGVLVPNTLEGAGTLTLTEHSGRGMAGRMAGTLMADLSSDKTGESVSIEMTFDVNLACAG